MDVIYSSNFFPTDCSLFGSGTYSGPLERPVDFKNWAIVHPFSEKGAVDEFMRIVRTVGPPMGIKAIEMPKM
jgi:hypothetical protein